VRVALLNNRDLSAMLEQVGVSKADYQIAGQIKNPSFYIDFRPPDRRPPAGVDIEAALSVDVLDILLLPVRKGLAKQELDRSAVTAADAALQLVHDVRVGFYTLVADGKSADSLEAAATAVDTARDFARRQHDAGNITDREWAERQADAAEAKLEAMRARLQVEVDRASLNRLMGLSGSQTHWTAADDLPPIPAVDPADADTVDTAMKRRLDAESADRNVAIAQSGLDLTRKGVLTSVSVGASMERETDKQTVIGPSLGVDVPIFNQHQGEVARAEAEVRIAGAERQAMRSRVESEVTAALARVRAARAAAELADTVLVPQRQAVIDAATAQYNGMLVGIFDLLSAREKKLSADRESIAARLAYWTARAELDRSVGR
jgi:cobalt-zinc-cadmium efflux system outer membrane protein